MKKKIPTIKKKINSFLLDEDGKISKKDIMKSGALITGLATSILLSSETVSAGTTHANSYNTNGDCVTHAHHGSHSSHSSHGSGGWC